MKQHKTILALVLALGTIIKIVTLACDIDSQTVRSGGDISKSYKIHMKIEIEAWTKKKS